ncbi:MAG: DPP IV N-terminal domain-containing protein, partial [Gemmatimonadales bacterium]
MCARRRGFCLPLLLLVSLLPGSAPAQETASDTLLTVNHYLDWEQVSDPQLSPDGSQIIYTRRWVNRIEDRWESALWIMQADGSRNRFLTKGSDARWSPDGARIAYRADGEPKGSQIFVRWMDAEGATSQITRVTESPANLRWAPDGRSVSFAMLVRKDDPWKISMPGQPEGARWTPAPRIVRRLHYRQDRVGFMQDGFLHLFVVPSDGGTPRQLTSGEWNVGARFDGLGQGVGYDWTPDGKTIVFDGYRGPDADRNYRNSHLYAVDVASGTIRQLTNRPGTWTGPVVAPDGRTVAFVGVDSSRKSYEADALYVMGVDGAAWRKVSGDLD